MAAFFIDERGNSLFLSVLQKENRHFDSFKV
jgi:hypothetical protein